MKIRTDIDMYDIDWVGSTLDDIYDFAEEALSRVTADDLTLLVDNNINSATDEALIGELKSRGYQISEL